jgi:3-oxoacyl-[acyl-carrier protein] reductase
MIAQNAGVILNASSVVGIYGNFGQTNYAASKFGVIAWPRLGRANSGARAYGANAVCPGFVETTILKSIPQKVMQAMIDRVPLGRLANRKEIANTYAVSRFR